MQQPSAQQPVQSGTSSFHNPLDLADVVQFLVTDIPSEPSDGADGDSYTAGLVATELALYASASRPSYLGHMQPFVTHARTPAARRDVPSAVVLGVRNYRPRAPATYTPL